ncbi:hypothetical protein HKX48_000173 [Thoreauomyces humboldtii]|nr:hypothetical protein HKX48_000173 [Thoreauomyces humboldtii]
MGPQGQRQRHQRQRPSYSSSSSSSSVLHIPEILTAILSNLTNAEIASCRSISRFWLSAAARARADRGRRFIECSDGDGKHESVRYYVWDVVEGLAGPAMEYRPRAHVAQHTPEQQDRLQKEQQLQRTVGVMVEARSSSLRKLTPYDDPRDCHRSSATPIMVWVDGRLLPFQRCGEAFLVGTRLAFTCKRSRDLASPPHPPPLPPTSSSASTTTVAETLEIRTIHEPLFDRPNIPPLLRPLVYGNLWDHTTVHHRIKGNECLRLYRATSRVQPLVEFLQGLLGRSVHACVRSSHMDRKRCQILRLMKYDNKASEVLRRAADTWEHRFGDVLDMFDLSLREIAVADDPRGQAETVEEAFAAKWKLSGGDESGPAAAAAASPALLHLHPRR